MGTRSMSGDNKESKTSAVIGLIKEIQAERVAEIGVWRGGMCREILRNEEIQSFVKEYWAVDIWDKGNSRKTYEDWHSMYLNVCKYLPFFPQLKVLRISSIEASKLFINRHLKEKRYFDLVFIDADHTFDAVFEDIQAWLPLIRDGGVLCGHDYYKGAGARHPGVAKAVDSIFDSVEIFSDTVWVKRICQE
jgi:hypothetical protein